jgi:hypothetical protein
MTTTEYNDKSSDCITAVPVSSKDNNLTGDWNIAKLRTDDIDPKSDINPQFDFKIEKSYILCDRPCRIYKSNLKNKNMVTKLHMSRYNEIIDQMARFMKFG